MTDDVTRIVIDDIMASLLAAEDRVNSLETDVKTYREMTSILLTKLASQTAQVERLMWRLKQGTEPRRG